MEGGEGVGTRWRIWKRKFALAEIEAEMRSRLHFWMLLSSVCFLGIHGRNVLSGVCCIRCATVLHFTGHSA